MIRDGQTASEEDVRLCERLMRITLPAEARQLGFASVAGMDGALLLKIGLAAQELPHFLQNSPFKDEPFSTVRRFVPEMPDMPWWNIGGVRAFKAAQVFLHSAALNVLVDLDGEQEEVIVYLFYHET